MLINLSKIAIRSLVFLTFFFIVISYLGYLFTESKKSIWDHFYAQKKNTVDILILGNSHSNAGVDQDIIEAKLNANVVSLATRGQNIYQSYYCALEAYKYQTPEVLIIENFLFYERLTMDAFINQDPSINDYRKRYLTFEGKKMSEIKIDESQAFFKGNVIENMFPAIKNHQKWTNIDAIKEKIYSRDEKVNRKSTTMLSKVSVKEYDTKTSFDLSEYNLLPDEENALEQIVDLAKDKGTKRIILLTVPFYKGYRDKINYESLDSPLKQFADKYPEITYLDLNKTYKNWNRTYFSNDPVGYNQHTNYKGAIVISNYLVKVIEEEFNNKFKNINNDLPESYLYKGIKKEETLNNNRFIGNLETINDSKQLKYIIDQGRLPIVFKGWMAIEDIKSANNEMFIGLVKNDNFVYISQSSQLKHKNRRDVTEYFKKEKGFYDKSGFITKIDTNLLEKGVYNIYMIIKTKNEIVLKKTYKVVEIK